MAKESVETTVEEPVSEETGGTDITGRSVFAIETTPAGVVVRTAFMTEDNRMLDMPAVFPDALYAFSVLDDLKAQVAQHFSQAARVGAQVISEQARNQQAPVEDAEEAEKTEEAQDTE